jgi:hypothetical protein
MADGPQESFLHPLLHLRRRPMGREDLLHRQRLLGRFHLLSRHRRRFSPAHRRLHDLPRPMGRLLPGKRPQRRLRLFHQPARQSRRYLAPRGSGLSLALASLVVCGSLHSHRPRAALIVAPRRHRMFPARHCRPLAHAPRQRRCLLVALPEAFSRSARRSELSN